MVRRHTIQKDLILQAVRQLRGHVSADEVYEVIKKEHPSIGKGTVYRNLGILAEEGEIKRIPISDGPDRFDFTLNEHYHVRCVKCDKVEDVDMDILPDLLKMIQDPHGFEFQGYDVLFRGICPKCRRADAKE